MQNQEKEVSGIQKYLAKDILPLDGPEEPLRAGYDLMLISPPIINLSDPLSSTWESFEIWPGNYSWNYKDGEEMTGVIACGVHPLDEIARTDKLKLPQYQRMDTILYSISIDAAPDQFIVRKWDVSDAGNTQAKELSVITIYEPTLLLHLEPDKIYELTAVWEKEKADMRGFYGRCRLYIYNGVIRKFSINVQSGVPGCFFYIRMAGKVWHPYVKKLREANLKIKRTFYF